MRHHLTRRALLASALGSVATVAFAEAPLTSLRPVGRPGSEVPLPPESVASILAEADLGGITGYVVADLETGEVLESGDADAALPPASVTKAVTALYALETLGPTFTYRTQLLADGPILDGVLNGNLILAGSGNPNLLTDDLVALVANMHAAGLKEVKGGFQVWGEALPYLDEIDESQLDHLGYNPSVSGLNLNFNRVHFEWRRANGAYSVSMDARSETVRPTVYTSRMRIVDRRLPIYTYERGDRRDEWTVARTALGDAGSRWLPVRNPRLYAGDVFQTLARAKGVALANPEIILSLPDGATELAGIDSEDLRSIMRDMLDFSTNITAEAAGLLSTARRMGAVQGLVASAAQMTSWTNAKSGGKANFADHSGLSDASAISAADMVAFLSKPDAIATLGPILKVIPMTDADRRDIPGFPAQVLAKTGTLNFVTTLAGYVGLPSGRNLAFAIFAAEPDARAAGKLLPDEQPPGAAAWNRRAKRMQQRLLQRWAKLYGQESENQG